METDHRSLWKTFVRRVSLLLALTGIVALAYNFATEHGRLAGGLTILLALGGAFLAIHLLTRQLDRRLEQVNRRYEALLAEQNAILQTAAVGIAFVRNRQIVSCNRRFEEIFGFGSNELTGCSTRWIYGSNDIYEDVGLRAYATLGRGDKFSEEVVLRHRDGHTFWGAMTGRALDPQHPERGAIWIYADISERRKATEETNKLLRAVEQSPVSILITDRAGAIEYVNPRFCQVSGYSREEAIGQSPHFLDVGETPPEVFENMRCTLFEGREWRGELRNRRKNGELFWEEVSISPIVADSGEITHFIAVNEDITERMEAQRRQEAHQAQLEELVQQRTADLSRALEAARTADRAKGEFLANVSHEMRTPLNAVIGLSGLAMKGLADRQQRDYLEKIAQAGQTLLGIINDLLDLSKIAAGRLELEKIPFSIAQTMERVSAIVSHRITEKKLGFKVDIDPALPPTLVGDPLRLEQILLNLLTNAIKFTAQGGIAVRFRQHSRREGEVTLIVEVEDTGVGLAPAAMARLFQPFSQADNSITRTHGGTGLGLAICRRLSEMMGGDIDVASRHGFGSTFRVQVVLGVAAAGSCARQESAPAAGIDHIRYRDSRVLVVDDQPVNRQIVHELLQQVGIACLEAANGREAVERVGSQPAGYFDLIFMDIQMPEMDGHSATRAIHGLPGRENLPIVAMTAYAMEHEKQASLAAGMNDHLGKPFVPDTLYRLLARWMPADRQYRDDPPPAAPAAAPSPPEIAGVDTQSGLQRFAGNRAAYRRWLEKVRDEGGASLAELVGDLREGRRDNALRTLHTMKGRFGMLGMTGLWQTAAALESCVKEERDFAALLADFGRQMEQILANLRAALPAPQPT